MRALFFLLCALPLQADVRVERFVPLDTPSDAALEAKIAERLHTALQEHGLSTVQNGYSIRGQYRKTRALSLYAQIYSHSGELIDAYAVEVSDETLDMDPEEARGYTESQIDSFALKVALRIKSNPRAVSRPDNINEYLRATRAARVVDLPRTEISSRREVFQILQERVTVASNVVAEAEKQPVSVTVITAEQIRMTGARTLTEALTMLVPGYFAVQDQDDVIAGFRGLAPDNNSKVLLLLNGHNLNTEWFFGPPDSIINGMNLEFIDRIEVIRGPGSVTLGQGALLGVINIVTAHDLDGAAVHVSGGQDGWGSASFQGGRAGALIPGIHAYVFAQQTAYSGQALRNEGWAHDRAYEGTEGWYDARVKAKTASQLEIYKNVAKSGNRLGRANGQTVFANISYAGFALRALHTDQIRDQYNFYRDRNELRNVVTGGDAVYQHDFSERLSLKGSGFFTLDDVILQSHGGQTMGGTREERYGGSALLRWNSAGQRNRLAVGAEYRRYDSGLPDRNGNNFIVNKADATLLDDVNNRHRYVFPESIIVSSGFVEDFFALTRSVDLFGAVRYDKHIFWGANVSPRVGLLLRASESTRFRFSYQEGFRGAVGLSYAGGFQGDGLLRSANFDSVALARIPTTDQFNQPAVYDNIPEASPEKMRSYEAAAVFDLSPKWTLEGVMFYNLIRDVIDVGVIFADPAAYTMPRIGTDQPGDWNGYFFFRNLPGVIRSGGFEGSLSYKSERLHFQISHALARVLSASDSLYFKPYGGGMYLSEKKDNKHFRAYPENVTRASGRLTLGPFFFTAAYLYYANWYSPVGSRVEGNHIMNTGAGWKIQEKTELSVTVRNIFASGALYPMNSNAGDVALADGSPALEGRSYFVTLRSQF